MNLEFNDIEQKILMDALITRIGNGISKTHLEHIQTIQRKLLSVDNKDFGIKISESGISLHETQR